MKIFAETVIDAPGAVFIFGRQIQRLDVAFEPTALDGVVLCMSSLESACHIFGDPLRLGSVHVN